MTIKFKANIPDEPFKKTFTKGNTVDITYKGERFLVIGVSKGDNRLQTCDASSDNIEELDLNEFVDDSKNFHIIDAQKHPLIACFLTHFYDNEEYPDYEEELPTGEIYTYMYESSGILGNIYKSELPVYFPEEDRFGTLELLEPAISKESFDDAVEEKIKTAKELIDNASKTDLTEENKLSVQTYLIWLENIKTNYPNIDHWKIPFKPIPSF